MHSELIVASLNVDQNILFTLGNNVSYVSHFLNFDLCCVTSLIHTIEFFGTICAIDSPCNAWIENDLLARLNLIVIIFLKKFIITEMKEKLLIQIY